MPTKTSDFVLSIEYQDFGSLSILDKCLRNKSFSVSSTTTAVTDPQETLSVSGPWLSAQAPLICNASRRTTAWAVDHMALKVALECKTKSMYAASAITSWNESVFVGLSISGKVFCDQTKWVRPLCHKNKLKIKSIAFRKKILDWKAWPDYNTAVLVKYKFIVPLDAVVLPIYFVIFLTSMGKF